jgi:hypothetical protein
MATSTPRRCATDGKRCYSPVSAPPDCWKNDSERCLAAILAADVAGYSRLNGADEEDTLGGWTADPERNNPGRDLAYTRYDKMAEALGCYAEYVEEPEGIRPALQRTWKKVEEDMVGFVNVKTDYRARATTVRFSSREET